MANCFELDLPQYKQSLRECCGFLDNLEFSAVNYHRWPICSDACSLGASLKVPVYQFVKEALIRKFGEDWYQELTLVAETYKAQNENINRK